MKFFILFSCIYVFSFGVHAQSKIDIENDCYNNNTFLSQQEKIVVWDSSYYYIGDKDNWRLSYRNKSLKRNNEGLILESINHFWNNEFEKWELKDTISQSLFNSTQLKSRLTKPWLSGQNIWGDTIFYVEYDKNDNQLINIFKNWDYKKNKVIRGFNYHNRYDDNNLIISKTIKTLDTITLKWVNNNKKIYTYDGNKRKDTIKYGFWIWGNWELFKMDIYKYNDQSQLAIKLIQKSDIGTNTFKNKEKQIYSYNDKGNLEETLIQSWIDSIWTNKRKITNLYDERNNIIKKTYAAYKENKWINSLRIFYKYNNDDNQTEYLSELWDEDKGVWVNSNKTNLNYDSNGQLILLVKKKWDKDTNQWDNVNKYVFYLSEFETSNITNTSLDKAYIYPNPTKGEINISNNSIPYISIYDIHGKLIKMSANTHDINIKDQPSGIYFIEYLENGKKSLIKIIKE